MILVMAGEIWIGYIKKRGGGEAARWGEHLLLGVCVTHIVCVSLGYP